MYPLHFEFQFRGSEEKIRHFGHCTGRCGILSMQDSAPSEEEQSRESGKPFRSPLRTPSPEQGQCTVIPAGKQSTFVGYPLSRPFAVLSCFIVIIKREETQNHLKLQSDLGFQPAISTSPPPAALLFLSDLSPILFIIFCFACSTHLS